MELNRSFSVILFIGLMLFQHSCAYVGATTGTDHATVKGGMAYIDISPSVSVKVPVNVAIGDKVAEAAANAAVGYLKGLPGGITSISEMNRAEAVKKGVAAGKSKAAETGQQINQNELEMFTQHVVAEI